MATFDACGQKRKKEPSAGCGSSAEPTLRCDPTLKCDELETTADQESQKESRLLVLGFLQSVYACWGLTHTHALPEPVSLAALYGRQG